jgi:hypothetical protein
VGFQEGIPQLIDNVAVPAGLHKGNAGSRSGIGEIGIEAIHLLLSYRWVKQQGNEVTSVHCPRTALAFHLILITRL